MSETQTAIAPLSTAEKKPIVSIGVRGLEVKSLDDLWRVSNYIANSGLAPKGLEKAEAIFVAVELGLELGLPIMAALQNIAVINGRPGVFGDVQLAIVRSSGLLEDYAEKEVGEAGKDTFGIECICKRAGTGRFANSRFTVADAKLAGLWGKSGPWTQYPKRMLKFRARGFLLRDEFGDVLKGVRSVEEMRDQAEEDRFANAKNVHPMAPDKISMVLEKALPPLTPDPPTKGPTLVTEPISQEEKKLAEAGLAPTATTVTDQPKADSPAEQSIQSKLEGICLANQVTFDEFRAYGNGMGWDADWDSLGEFAMVPKTLAEMVVKAQSAVMKQIAKWKAGKAGAR